MGDRTHAAQWHQRQARGCATELSYHYKLQGNDVAVSASDDSQALPGTSIAQACLTAGDDLGISVLPNAQEGWADRAWSDPCNRAATQDG